MLHFLMHKRADRPYTHPFPPVGEKLRLLEGRGEVTKSPVFNCVWSKGSFNAYPDFTFHRRVTVYGLWLGSMGRSAVLPKGTPSPAAGRCPGSRGCRAVPHGLSSANGDSIFQNYFATFFSVSSVFPSPLFAVFGNLKMFLKYLERVLTDSLTPFSRIQGGDWTQDRPLVESTCILFAGVRSNVRCHSEGEDSIFPVGAYQHTITIQVSRKNAFISVLHLPSGYLFAPFSRYLRGGRGWYPQGPAPGRYCSGAGAAGP